MPERRRTSPRRVPSSPWLWCWPARAICSKRCTSHSRSTFLLLVVANNNITMPRELMQRDFSEEWHKWKRDWTPHALAGMGLGSSTVGIYGMGRIGTRVAEKLVALGVKHILFR